MKFGSVCSGIEAASVAWNQLDMHAEWFAEVDPFSSKVLAHHYPNVPNLGDINKLPDKIREGSVPSPEILCGGTPCQAFSVAGLRNSLDDARGNLSLTFCEIADEIDNSRVKQGMQPCIIFWENVPGCLSTKDNFFGCFLAELAGESSELIPPGRKWSNAGIVLGPKRAVVWRTLDAQHFGVAQRRKRVFVVATARDGFDPSKVLFDFEDVRRDTAPSRPEAKNHTFSSPRGIAISCYERHDQDSRIKPIDVFPTVHSKSDNICDLPLVVETPWQGLCKQCKGSGSYINETCGQCNSVGSVTYTLFNPLTGQGTVDNNELTLRVRRITPVECERLQGFPDNYTCIPWKNKPEPPDSLRYRAVGNSWAVPVIRWIGSKMLKELSKET